jgi:hypothetical protein
MMGCGLDTQQLISREFIQQAEPGVTLRALTTNRDRHQSKGLLLGGVPLADIRASDRLGIELRNQPLEADYLPHRPLSHGGLEDGHYWAVVSTHDFPPTKHTWARVTVVGQVVSRLLSASAEFTAKSGPLLAAPYLRAWPVADAQAETWQDRRNPHYLDPRGYGEPFQLHCRTSGSLYGGE